MAEVSLCNSYLYATTVASIDISPDQAHEKVDLTPEMLESIKQAVAELEAAGVVAIGSDCGAMVHYQDTVEKLTPLPVALSPLLQCPMLAAMHDREGDKFLVLTSDSTTMTAPKLQEALEAAGVQEADRPRFVLQGCENVEGFSRERAQSVGEGFGFDISKAKKELVDLVQEVRAHEKRIRLVLIESDMLPLFADVLRKELALPVFDNTTLLDYMHKGMTNKPRWGINLSGDGPVCPRKESEELPVFGILRIEYSHPPAFAEPDCQNSYYYRMPHATVVGLKYRDVSQGRDLTSSQREAMKVAIFVLEETPGVQFVVGDSCFLTIYKEEIATMARKCTFFLSALLQAPLLASLFAPDESILVLTANAKALEPALPTLLTECHVPSTDHSRFIIAGCERVPGFQPSAKQKVDVNKVQPAVIEVVQRAKSKHPKLRAVLLECMELPPYADAIREATGLLVVDAITLVDYYQQASSENPYYGIDWQTLADTPHSTAETGPPLAAEPA